MLNLKPGFFMKNETISLTEKQARQLFIYKQHLHGNREKGNFQEIIMPVIRGTGYIQWDPVTVVAPSHMISIWSRIGDFPWSDLEKLMWS